MSTANNARLGYWVDHNRRNLDKHQILATDFWSTVMKAVVAISLTLVAPYVYKIGSSFLIWLFDQDGSHIAKHNQRPEAIPLLNDDAHEASIPREGNTNTEREATVSANPTPPSGVLRGSHSHRVGSATGSMYNDDNDDMERPEPPEDDGEGAWLFLNRYFAMRVIIVIVLVFLTLFVAQAIAGVFTAKIASDRAGLTSSAHCGIWQYDDSIAGDEDAYLDDLRSYQKEARASQYARTCYNPPDPVSPLYCRMFYNQSIKFDTQIQQICPFPALEMCQGGAYTAVTFDTGLIDASTIGINAKVTHKFRRTTTCSPLNMSESYIKLYGSPNETMFRYYYGNKDDIEYTFNTSGRPFEWLVPVYSINTYFSSLYPEEDYWHPLPQLKQPNDSSLTIMFVSSMHIYHEEPSYDPIFNATQPRYFKNQRKPFYYNSDPRARVLACIDKSEVCSPDGKVCWSMTSPVPDSVPTSPAYWLMKWALENSNAYDSIKWRLGTALIAQESISQSISAPLPPDQWQLEASQLFATSLARIQYDAWSIATGEDRNQGGYNEVTPDEAKGQLCGLYKFKTLDYTNINLVAFLGLIVLSFVIFILALDASSFWLMPKSKKEKYQAEKEEYRTPTLMIDLLVNGIIHLLRKSAVLAWRGMKIALQKSKQFVLALI